MNSERFITRREVAKSYGVTDPTVTNWIKAGKLKALTTPGGHHRIYREQPLIRGMLTDGETSGLQNQ